MTSVSVEENSNDKIDDFPLSNLQQAYLFGTQHAFDLRIPT